ncbi:MAG TPA: hypothetical protein DIW64_14680 [Cellvibrio sp.]|nr:hypothetical protein [Cellvibrio sp.]
MSSPFDKGAILKGDVAQLRALFAAASSPAQLNRLYRVSVEHLVNTLLNGDQLDEVFSPLIERFRQKLIKEVTHDSYFFVDPLHPLRRLLDCLLQHACYWYPRDLTQQSLFLQQYQRLADEVLQAAVNPGSIWSELGVFNDFNQWMEAEYKRSELVELRVCQAAINNFRLLEAECSVLDLINNSLAGKNIPVDAHSLFIGALKSELQYHLINAGGDSPFWHSWGKILPVFAGIFSTAVDQTDAQHLSATISALLNDLQHSLQLGSSNPDNYQLLINRLSEMLSQLEKQQPLSCIPFKGLPYPEGYEDCNRKNTQPIQTEINEIKIGSWFIWFDDEGQTIRCKLALKNTNSKQLLFVARSGRKVMVRSSGELLRCLNAGIAKIFTPISFGDFFSHLLDKLITQANQLERKQEIRAAEAQAAHQKQKETEQHYPLMEIKPKVTGQVECPPQLVEGAIKQTAMSKKRAETLVRAEEKHRRVTAQTAKENAKREHLKKLECAKEQVAALNVGAMVAIYKGEHTSQRCKLAASIAVTGKYIFVDSRGRKFAEYEHEQLIEAILDNKLQVITSGDIFEDQLAKVIRGSR